MIVVDSLVYLTRIHHDLGKAGPPERYGLP